MRFNHITALATVAAAGLVQSTPTPNSTYLNPILPGWHSDPTCTQVNGTFFCAVSSFEVFPGLPIYASKDLINWKLISHGWNRESQLPNVSTFTPGQQSGMYAPNLRYHNSEFYLTCSYLSAKPSIGTIFKTTDIYSDAAWSDPVEFEALRIDPNLFWDDDGKVYLISQGIISQEINLETGATTDPISLWNGTGGVWPEGPHMYKKDGYYYLMIAEGGTAQEHMETIARSRNYLGPYTAYSHNPIISNANTTEYFQTVGHADLFQDPQGNWWGVCLSTRSGPAYEIYPMGRETVLFPVTWNKGAWPVLSPVRGVMSGWTLPPWNRNIAGLGAFNNDPDVVDFAPGSSIPSHFLYWRTPPPNTFTVSPAGRPNTLRISPSRTNLTGIPFSTQYPKLTGEYGIAFIARKQTDTLFTYSVDLDAFSSAQSGLEAGISAFLTQVNHIDLAIAMPISAPKYGASLSPELRFRIQAQGATNYTSSLTTMPVPASWGSGPVRLQVQTANDTHYRFSAMPSSNPNAQVILGYASAGVLSGGNGSFVGTLLGAYATCNGAGSPGNVCPGSSGDAYFSRWRYEGVAQYISADESVPSSWLWH